MSKIDKMIRELGHPESLLGTAYIRVGVPMYKPGMSMTKEFYPGLAAAVGSSPSKVERCIRHSIETAWQRGSMDAQLRFFGNSIDPQRGKPTVSEYVATMARLIHEAESVE